MMEIGCFRLTYSTPRLHITESKRKMTQHLKVTAADREGIGSRAEARYIMLGYVNPEKKSE